jgi:hypothetical protein
VLLDIILRLEPFEFQIGFEFKFVYNLQKEIGKRAFLFSSLAWAETQLTLEPARPSLTLPFPARGPATG